MNTVFHFTLDMTVCQRGNVQTDTGMAEIAVQRGEGGTHYANTGHPHREKSPSSDSPPTLGFGSWDALGQCKGPVPRC